MNECFVFTQNARKHCRGDGWNVCLGHVIDIKKHTETPPRPIALNLCPASWLRVTAGLQSWPP